MKKMMAVVTSFIYGTTLLLLLADVYKSRYTVFSYLHVTSTSIEVWVIVLLIFIRVFFREYISSYLVKFNAYLVLPITLAVGIFLTVWDSLSPPNYVYSLTLLQGKQIFYISMFSLIVWILSHTDAWFSKYYPKVIFFGSFAYIAAAYIVSLFSRDVFARLSKEDHIVETVQVAVLVLAVFWSAQIAKILFKKKDTMNAVIFLIAAIVLILVAGDEISWGQRIFHLVTPDMIANNNDQQEITIHNLTNVAGFVGIGYVAIGFYGAFAWITQFLSPIFKKKPLLYYIPPWFCSFFFLFGFIYNFNSITRNSFFPGLWAESAELMLYSGIMLTLLTLFPTLNKKHTKK